MVSDSSAYVTGDSIFVSQDHLDYVTWGYSKEVSAKKFHIMTYSVAVFENN